MKIKTTVKELREGIKISSGDEVHWESTGHLSVRLLDASGNHPLAGRSVNVNIPGEGGVSLQTDDKGTIFHPDVPFQDYELDVEGVKVLAPVVGEKTEVHERHVASAPMGFVQGVVYSPHGMLVANGKLEVMFPSGDVVESMTDEDGILRCHHAVPGEGDVTLRYEGAECKAPVLASPQRLLRLALEASR